MYLTPKQTLIVRYLAQGIKPTQVASLVGCTPALISQMVKDEKVLEALEEERAKNTGTATEVEQRLELKSLATMDRLLDKIGESAEWAEGRDLARFFEVVSARQDRIAQRRAPQNPSGVNVQVAFIALPAHAVQEPIHYQKNEQGQITAIGQRLMAPLSSEGTRALFAQIGQQKEQGEEEQKTLEDQKTLEAPRILEAVQVEHSAEQPKEHAMAFPSWAEELQDPGGLPDDL